MHTKHQNHISKRLIKTNTFRIPCRYLVADLSLKKIYSTSNMLFTQSWKSWIFSEPIRRRIHKKQYPPSLKLTAFDHALSPFWSEKFGNAIVIKKQPMREIGQAHPKSVIWVKVQGPLKNCGWKKNGGPKSAAPNCGTSRLLNQRRKKLSRIRMFLSKAL